MDVAVGFGHSLIVTDEGNVLSCGSSKFGELGYVSEKNVLSPNVIDSLNHEHIVHVSCGICHSGVISKSGKLFTFGGHKHGQCGVGNSNEKIFVPTNVVLPNGLIPVLIACGEAHTLILTTNHCVLSCGNGELGRLGHGNEDKQNTPQIIEALTTKHIVNIDAGGCFSLCVSKDGDLYTFGDGYLGTLGHPFGPIKDGYPKQITPKVVRYFKDKNIKIRECVAGMQNSGAISVNGEVYIWGFGECGQLGQGSDDTKKKTAPMKAEYFNTIAVKCLSLGNDCSFVVSDCIDLKEDVVDSVEKEWILKGDRQMNIKNGKDLRNRPFEIFVRNRMLFGDLEWVMFRKREDSAFPLYTTSFIDRLYVAKDGTIELADVDGIHKRYHSEILKATYLLLVNEGKAEIKKEDVENNDEDGLYVFGDSDLKNIKFKIPSSNEKGKEFTVSIYVQPTTKLNFHLLKQFCIE
eukprot:160543_1